MQIRWGTTPKDACWHTTTRGPNSRPLKHKWQQPPKTSNKPFDILKPPYESDGVCRLRLNSRLTKELCLLLCEWQREAGVLTERMEMANTSGADWVHVPHLPFVLGLPAQQIGRGIGVVLKWDEGKLRSVWPLITRLLKAGIKGAAANMKRERETYLSVEIRRLRLGEFQLHTPPTQRPTPCTSLFTTIKRPPWKKRRDTRPF